MRPSPSVDVTELQPDSPRGDAGGDEETRGTRRCKPSPLTSRVAGGDIIIHYRTTTDVASSAKLRRKASADSTGTRVGLRRLSLNEKQETFLSSDRHIKLKPLDFCAKTEGKFNWCPVAPIWKPFGEQR